MTLISFARKFWVEKAPLPASKPVVDFTRRGFIFGATAALILPPERTFHILPPTDLILAPLPQIIRPDKPFDLPLQQMLQLLDRLDAQKIEMSAIPRWVVTDKAWYDQMVEAERRTS